MRHNNAKKLTFAQDLVSPLGMRKAEALALSEEEFAFFREASHSSEDKCTFS